MAGSDPLARVTRAATQKHAADREYRLSVRDAHTAGHTFADIARAASVSRQAVAVIVRRTQARR